MKVFVQIVLVCFAVLTASQPTMAQEAAVDDATASRPARSPVERLAARRESESQEVQDAVRRDMNRWLPLSGEDFLARVEPWFSEGGQSASKLRMNTVKFVAGEKLLRGEVVSSSADVAGRLYLLAYPRLTSTEKKSLIDRFATEGALSSLGPVELLAQVDRIAAGESGRQGLLLKPATRKVAARLLLDDGAIETADAEVLDRLHNLGKRFLSEAEKQSLRQRLLDLRSLEANASFEELKAYFKLTDLGRPTRESESTRRGLVADWVRGQRIGRLTTPQQGWLLQRLRPRVSFGPNQQVDVTWSGNLTVPRDGEYTLSVTPIDRNAQLNRDYRKLSILVRVGGEEVINAAGTDQETADDWKWQSEPLRLSAGRPVSFEYSATYAQSLQHGMRPEAVGLVASWEGGGMSRTVIPATAFTTDEGEPGLTATYRWTDREGVAQEISGIDSNVDCCWAAAWQVNHENRAMRERLAAAILRACSKPRVLSGVDPQDMATHPVFGSNRNSVARALESASNETRDDWIDRLCQQSDHFKPVHFHQLCSIWPRASVGVEDHAFDLIVAYCEAHANAPCVFDHRGFISQRGRYALMAVQLLGCQCSGSIERLEAEGLEDEAGNCNLPVAYMCAYGYHNQGKLIDWIEKLDGVLEDPATTGDLRVNWLIARAMAEEIRGFSLQRFSPRPESLGAGMGYLEEGLLVARSDEKKQLLHIERFVRFAAMGRFDSAEAELESINDSERFSKAIAQLKQRRVDQAEAAVVARTQSIINELKRRQRSAAKLDDRASAAKYGNLIQELESTAESQ